MREVSKKNQEQLENIKKKIRGSYDYFSSNYEKYHKDRKFLLASSYNADELNMLSAQNKPQLEFNILNAYRNRWVGEFSKQQPDIEVNSVEEMAADAQLVKFVSQHLRYQLSDNDNEHVKLEAYDQLLTGGMAVLKVYTDYKNEMSMQQVIKFALCEPTLCGFAKNARLRHKGDGDFAFECFPMVLQDFKEDYPKVKLGEIAFSKQIEGFNWSYNADKEDIIMVCDFYQKRFREKNIVQVKRDGQIQIMEYEQYKKMIDEWEDDNITLPPPIIGKPRKTKITTIDRYRLIENQIIEVEETDFSFLPLIFMSGISFQLREGKSSKIQEKIFSAFHHASGAQRLKNYAGNCLANALENMNNAQFFLKKEAIPKEKEFEESLVNPQIANIIAVNAFYEENPDQPIPDPIREIAKVPIPPEVGQAFTGADSLIQNVLGSYDASLGINNNQLSGIAIVEAASQSNATAMPFIVGVLQGLQRAAQVYVDLMPKYYTTPMTLPIIDDQGRKSFIKINQKEGINLDYDSNSLNVILKAGASFQIQKSRTIMMVKEIMQMSPLFAQFVGEKGINFILDNMEGKGIEELKLLVDGWLQEYQQQKQQAAQQNPEMMRRQIEIAKLQQTYQKNLQKLQLDMAKLQADQQKVLADIHLGQQSADVQLIKAQTERFAKQVDLELHRKDMHHRHMKDISDIHHRNMTSSQSSEQRY